MNKDKTSELLRRANEEMYNWSKRYEALLAEKSVAEKENRKLHTKYDELRAEYDKLKGENERLGDALNQSAKWLADEMAEHAALKEKADNLSQAAKALVDFYDGWLLPENQVDLINALFNALSSYNSNTNNQNENNG